MSCISPYSFPRGLNFCGDGGYHYIVRSELGRYMKTQNLDHGDDVKLYDLHHSCKGGDHYLANGGYFYIIEGKNYRRVTNMNNDADSVVYSLHPNCQGGDHYLSMCGKFYVIYKEKGVYRKTTNLNNDEDAVEYFLHSNCKDGLYFWGLDQYAYIIKPPGSWGPEFHKTSNMNHDWDSSDSSFTNRIKNFLSGALEYTNDDEACPAN